MLAKRIIPCLDIRDGRTVKGINFVDIQDAGDPVENALRYAQEGADELVFLDITATIEKRRTLAHLVNNVASAINIPFTVGGGIQAVADVALLLQNGADKISINSAAVRRPEMIDEIQREFGSQCVVLAVDIKQENDGQWYVYLNGGRLKTDKLATDWILEAEARGAGEVLLTSMDHDGTRNGFALDITAQIGKLVNIPVIASGGGGTPAHFRDVFGIAGADAALAASVFPLPGNCDPGLERLFN